MKLSNLTLFLLSSSALCEATKSKPIRGASNEPQQRALATRNLQMMMNMMTTTPPPSGPVATEIASVGGVTTTSAKVGFRTDSAARVHVLYATNLNFNGQTFSYYYDTLAADDFTGSIELTNLQPAQKYWYRIYVDGIEQDPGTVQKFETFPNPGATFRFSIFADSAPYYNNQAADVYAAGSSNPNKDGALFALQIGDFDHSDPTDIAGLRLMHRGLRDMNTDGGVDFAKNVLSKMAFAHVYDDHDVSMFAWNRFMSGSRCKLVF